MDSSCSGAVVEPEPGSHRRQSLRTRRTAVSWRGRAEKIWTAADEAAFLERAPAHLHLPLLLALWTGQRQGDLLRLPWSAYDGKHIRLRQSKTGVRLFISITCLSVVVRQLYGDQKRSPAVTIRV